MRNSGARRLALTMVLALWSAAQLAAQDTTKRVVKQRTLYEDLQLFSGVLNQIRVNHPDTSITTHQLVMAAIRGMVQAADPYSGVSVGASLTPEKEKAMREGKLHPIGVQFAYLGSGSGLPVVMSVLPGSSASKLDILRGDELVAIDGKPVLAETDDELFFTLLGEKRSTVRLTLQRRRADGTKVEIERAVKREKIGEDDMESSVPVAFMLDAQTGYIRIASFNDQKVYDDLKDGLDRLENRGMKRLMLDLRDNGGGFVNQASSIAGLFLPKGTIVYTVDARKTDVAKDTGRVERSFWSSEKRYPMIVMVNGGSASASELVAGALQDHDRALIVGSPSHGKALLMRMFPIYDGASVWSTIYLNVGRIRTPCGRIVQREYRGMRRQEYFRRAYTDRDTVGRPSCKTSGGRTVYGGGGIYPDVRLAETELVPPWLSLVREGSLAVRWVGGHVSENAALYPSLDAVVAKPEVSAAALANFREFAGKQGVRIPSGADADLLLQRELIEQIALTKWGDAGRYRVVAVVDPDVKLAASAFEQARSILAVAKQD